jgi:hypothetical protein
MDADIVTGVSSATLAVPAVISAVKAARTTFPKIDGVWVLAVALAAGFAVSYLFGDASDTVRQTLKAGALYGLAGSGFMEIAQNVSTFKTAFAKR